MTRHSFSWRAAPLIVAAALACAPVRAQLPTLGEGADLTVSAERKLGEKVARELYRDPDYIADPVLDDYVQGIWMRLLAASRARGEIAPELDERFAWQILLGKDRTINAFALPGGWMGLNLGLISATSSKDEVAAVLGHELSHVTQRHISRLMTQQSRQMPILLGALILAAIAAGRNGEAAQAAAVGGQALTMQNQLNFSRDMEREADRVGFGVATQAGFDPRAFVSMFEKLQHASRLNDNGAFPYLRTHPMTTERIADMQSRMPLAGRAAPPAPDMVHMMMAGRAKVLSEPGVDVLRDYVSVAAQQAGGNRAQQAGALYAAALASAKLRDIKSAATLSQRLADLAAGDPAAARESTLLAAEIALQAGDPTMAAALAGAPGRPELMFSSQARLQSGRAAEATDRLQTWVALHPKDAPAWQLLSQVYAAQGQTLRAIRADAESQVSHLDLEGAMDRFRAAQEFSRKAGANERDHIEASIIDARAREVASLLREQALER